MKITIDGTKLEVKSIYELNYLKGVNTDDGCGYYVAESTESAGEASKQYWTDMAENDPREFACIVGEGTLVKWALGHSAGLGAIHVHSLNEWLDLVAQYPEEDWARYDGVEMTVDKCSKHLREALGFTPTVAYRYE